MIFNKSLLILGSLAGASVVGIGGYFGISALDTHFSKQDTLRNPENDGSASREENSEVVSNENGQSREVEGGLPTAERATEDGSPSDQGTSTDTAQPRADGTTISSTGSDGEVRTEQEASPGTGKETAAGDNSVSPSAVAGQPTSQTASTTPSVTQVAKTPEDTPGQSQASVSSDTQ